MASGFDLYDDPPTGVQAWPWLSRVALSWCIGIVIGSVLPWKWAWLIGGAIGLMLAFVYLRRDRSRVAHWLSLITLALLAAGWLAVQRDDVAGDNVTRFMQAEPVIVKLQGKIISEPRGVGTQQGPFGDFNYQGPGTLFELSVSAIDPGSGFEPASGILLVRVKQDDHRPRLGQRIEAAGWMSPIGPTMNPGEFDYRAYLREQGVVGRLTLIQRGNWRPLGPPPRWTFTGLRRSIGDSAARSLRLGMPDDSEMIGLLDALLLGRRTGDIDDLSKSFRAVGLSHVLSISGAHLGILLLLVWGLARLTIGRPRIVTLVVLAVLMLFLLAVPWRTPIVRAAIMSAVFCVGYGMGRKLTGVEMLSAAALIVLIWKPTDLFNAGFQLSFGVVGAILLFARPVSRRILPESEAKVVHPSPWDLGLRWLVDLTAVSVVAFMVALPMVMYHFSLVSPLAAVLSMLALPVLTVVLAAGYLKIIVGLVSPALGSLLAVPLAWASDSLSGLVVQAQRWPGASFTLVSQPSVAWALGALVFVVAFLAGGFTRRYVALACCLFLIVGWAWVEQRPVSVMTRDDPPALVINMFAVGDGSCYLLRSGDQTLMFDCGSQAFWRVGERSIVPALSSLGVRQIDKLMLSHADLDHYVGVLDVIDAVTVDVVLASPDVLREAADRKRGAAAFLIRSLRERGHEPKPIEQGWRASLGQSQLELLWPKQGYVSEKNNNNGLVLRVKAAGRRVLMNSDIQGDAIERLLDQPDALRADVTDLAHHGSFVEQSPAWLEAVSPTLVLQSSGPRRPEQDQWKPVLEDMDIPRLWTNELGMVEVTIDQQGRITWTSHSDTRDD